MIAPGQCASAVDLRHVPVLMTVENDGMFKSRADTAKGLLSDTLNCQHLHAVWQWFPGFDTTEMINRVCEEDRKLGRTEVANLTFDVFLPGVHSDARDVSDSCKYVTSVKSYVTFVGPMSYV